MSVGSSKLSETLGLTAVAMCAFAANSILCRLALKDTSIDPASFTIIRILSAAVCLWLLLRLKGNQNGVQGSWSSAFALFAYAVAFSFAYIDLPAASGALLLFGAVQATMIGVGIWRGERLSVIQIIGLVMAGAGLVGLLMPGLSAPPLFSAILMVLSGIAWGVYSLRGRGNSNPTAMTAGNFIRAVPMLGLLLAPLVWIGQYDTMGVIYALLSGALASGLGYAIWYRALPGLTATKAASVQLSVPVITAVASVLFLNEAIDLRLMLASAAILGGVAIVIRAK